jgi:hypothetical protein
MQIADFFTDKNFNSKIDLLIQTSFFEIALYRKYLIFFYRPIEPFKLHILDYEIHITLL